MAAVADAGPRNRWYVSGCIGLTAGAAILAVALLGSLLSFEKTSISVLENILGRCTGLAVSIDRLGLNDGQLVLHDLALGKLLEVDQLQIATRWSAARPRIASVKLVRPRLTLQDLERLLANKHATKAPPAAAGRRVKRRPALVIVDGRMRFRWHGLQVVARGIHLDETKEPQRLVVGPLSVSTSSRTVVEIPAASLDLDKDRRPQRGAALAARVHLNREHSLNVKIARMIHRGGQYIVRLVARPPGMDGGTITARLIAASASGKPDKLELVLTRLALASFGSLLEPYGVEPNDNTRVDGRISLTGAPDDIVGEAAFSVDQLVVNHSQIAGSAIGPLDGTLRVKGRLATKAQTAVFDQLELATGGLRLRAEGTVARQDGAVVIDGAVRVPVLRCQKLLSALPAGFAPKLRGMAFAGKIGLAAHLALDTRSYDTAQVDVSLAPLSCRVLTDPPGADVKRLNKPFQARLDSGDGALERWVLGPENPSFVKLRDISGYVRSAFVVAEDASFFRHDGFDRTQLHNAFIDNLQTGRLLRGASTISQQLVKNVFLDHQRTLSRKFQEMVLTWRLEQVVPKKRILELYLNIVEMGLGIHGVDQASRTYFGKPAVSLTPIEAVHLAALTPSPRPLSQRFARAQPGASWNARLQHLLGLMRRRGKISQATYKRWKNKPVILKRN